MNGILWQGRSFAEAHLLPMSRTRSVIYVLTAPRIPLNLQLADEHYRRPAAPG
jgi:hypothetical protein